MFILKGFFNYSTMVDNTRDVVARFGELSSYASTYAKDKTYHTDEQAPVTTLVSFHSVKDDALVNPDIGLVTRILTLGQYIHDRANDGFITSDRTVFMQMVNAEFGTLVDDFAFGRLVNDGNLWMPEWISFQDTQLGEENYISIWLSDNAFRFGYDEYHIEIIPPFTPLDDFFKGPIQVQQKLNQFDLVEKLTEVQETRGEYPYTVLKALRFDYVDPSDNGWELPTEWLLVIYGAAGSNPDLMKQAIINYILDNSERPENDWIEILPEIFTTTEFVITPFWNKYGVPNRELKAGIYSPTVKPKDIVSILKQTTQGPQYSDSWIENEHEISNLIYKSLAFGVVGNPENQDEITSFYEKFTDYLIVTNNSPDYNRMEPRTQEFFNKLGTAVRLAEDLKPTTELPAGMNQLRRNGVDYVVFGHENTNYLVVGKPSLERLQGVS